MAGLLKGGWQPQAIEQADVAQMNEAGADVADMHPWLALVITAPVVTVVAQPLGIGGAERHRLQTQAMKTVYQPDVAGERHPFQPAHGQQIGDGDDAQPRATGIAGCEVTDLDNPGPVHRLAGS